MVGCRRTADASKYEPGTEIICGKCFRLAPKYLRRRESRIKRIMKRMGIQDWDWEKTRPGSAERRVIVLHYETWQKIKKTAIEARMGIR